MSGAAALLKRRKPSLKVNDREAFFRALFDHSPEGMVVLNARGKVHCVNHAARQFLSASCPGFESEFWKIGSNNGCPSLFTSENYPDCVIPCEVSKIDWEDETHTLAVLRKPRAETERKNADIMTSPQEENQVCYEKIFEHALMGFVLIKVVRDPVGKPVDFEFVSVNRTFGKAVNIDRAAIKGKSIRKVFKNVEKKNVWDALKDVAQSGNALVIQTYSEIFERDF